MAADLFEPIMFKAANIRLMLPPQSSVNLVGSIVSDDDPATHATGQ